MGRGLPKKYAKMGFAKGWQAYKKSKGLNKRTTKRKVVGVKKMAKRRYTRRKKYRRKKPKIPLETAIALGAIPFTPAWDGARSIIADIQSGYYEGVGNQLKSGFLGIDQRGHVDLFAALNPLDFNHARYTKMLIYSGIMAKVRKSLVKIPFGKVPFIGKYIS